MADVRISLDEITCHFHDLEDPRSDIYQRHPFVSVIVIAILAVLAGAGGPTSIAQWAKLKEAFLQHFSICPTACRARMSTAACWRWSIRWPFKPASPVG
ncbi:MAG TPA: transposase family protein [Fimbriiglobus sp.]|jgi:hypothetical protein|nr:transposase family protein [Fimbriiglobus sp.]